MTKRDLLSEVTTLKAHLNLIVNELEHQLWLIDATESVDSTLQQPHIQKAQEQLSKLKEAIV